MRIGVGALLHLAARFRWSPVQWHPAGRGETRNVDLSSEFLLQFVLMSQNVLNNRSQCPAGWCRLRYCRAPRYSMVVGPSHLELRAPLLHIRASGSKMLWATLKPEKALPWRLWRQVEGWRFMQAVLQWPKGDDSLGMAKIFPRCSNEFGSK